MELLIWGDALATGYPQIDEQHQQLVSIINEMITAVNEGAEAKIAIQTLMKLAQYAKEHFETEEKLLKGLSTIGFQEHKRMHMGFIDEVQDYAIMANSGAWSKLSTRMLTFLKNWLYNHILNQDCIDLGRLRMNVSN